MKQVLMLLILLMMSHNARTQDWLDTSLYPFQHKYMPLETGQMHYIDEGAGDVILFVHGTPTWSILYRDFVKELSKTHRCIAIDHLGFGLSTLSTNTTATPQFHADNLSTFIKALHLQKITLVVHDFGGPIGLAAAIENAKCIDKIVMFNTWLWATNSNADAQKIDKLVNSWLGKFLYLNLNISPKVLLKKGFSNKNHLSKKLHNQYIKPFPDNESRTPLLDLAKALIGASSWYQQQWQKLDILSDKEWLILWGSKDEFITMDYLAKWKQRLPQAKTIEFDCGHFVQEEKTEDSIKRIASFLE